MDFFLFLLVNAALFVRPGELIPALQGFPIYNLAIVLNAIVAGPAIVRYFIAHRIVGCPTTLCVLGMLCSVALSHVMRSDLWSARIAAAEFGKLVVYYLLLVSTVTTPRRLMVLLASILVFTLIINGLATLHYHGRIALPTLSVLMEMDYDEYTGIIREIPRMRATGTFNDPNDLSMIIVVSIIIAAGGMLYRPFGVLRYCLAAPMLFLFYALTLTQSRGGLLALAAAGGALLYVRFGLGRALALGVAGAPLALAGFGGRQTDFGAAIASGTGYARAELWSSGLQLFKQSPLFGIGYNRYAEEVGQVAHNSFLHAFVELGLFGGAMFFGVFAITAWSLWKLRPLHPRIAHPGLAHFFPYQLAVLVAFCVSMMSLTRNYVVPTYFIAGTAACYNRLAHQSMLRSTAPFQSSTALALGMASLGFIGAIYLYVVILYRLI